MHMHHRDSSSFISLWPGDAIWRHGTRSTLAHVMACCLTAPSHYLKQCWLIISEIPWHSSQGIILRRCEHTNQQNKIEYCNFKMASRSPRGQWVKQKELTYVCAKMCISTSLLFRAVAIRAWISNYIHIKLDVITNQCHNVRAWMSNYIPHKTRRYNSLSMTFKLSAKEGPCASFVY